jgi:hypothetical protein
MRLRRFNEAGIKAFRDFLAKLRTNPEAEIPLQLLENSQMTELVLPDINVSETLFETKGESARYFGTIFSKLRPEDVANDAGLWTWLSLLFFDSVCPDSGGKRLVRNDYHYVFEPRQMRYFYRHLLFISWQILRIAPEHNRLFLRSRVNTLDSITDQVMKRLYLTRIKCFFEVLDRLYWDESRRRPRLGITGNKVTAGSLRHRLPVRIRQLEKTYDLMSLDADQLIELLGDEFAFARPREKRLLFEEATHQ